MSGRTATHAIWALPLAAALCAWEIAGRSGTGTAFFISYPSAIVTDLVSALAAGKLWMDVAYTTIPAVAGLLLGALVGGGAGFALVMSPRVAVRLQPVVSFLGAFPVFAIAPMTLLWFGLGLPSKIFLAFVGCVFVFLQAAHQGGLAVPATLTRHFRAHRFDPWAEFTKLRLPHALDWLLSAFRSGANLALLGVFLGEFVASERGLARVMINAGALYDVKRVLAAAVLFTLVALAMMAIADLARSQRGRLIRLASVPIRTRTRKDPTWPQ